MLRLQITKQYRELLFKREIAHRGRAKTGYQDRAGGESQGAYLTLRPPSPPPFHRQNTHSSFFLYDLWRKWEFKCQQNCDTTS